MDDVYYDPVSGKYLIINAEEALKLKKRFESEFKVQNEATLKDFMSEVCKKR